MSIYIGGQLLGTQPSDLNEESLPIQTDKEAIDGTMRRYHVNQKKRATMVFPYMPPADYQSLISKFTTGSGVYYYNDQSNYTNGVFSFSGLPSYSESSYVPGASLYRPFSVVIREI